MGFEEAKIMLLEYHEDNKNNSKCKGQMAKVKGLIIEH